MTWNQRPVFGSCVCGQARDVLLQQFVQARIAGVRGRQLLEDVHHGHHEPAHAAAPDDRRAAGLRVGPGRVPVLVPRVIEQAGLRVEAVPRGERRLEHRHVVPERRVVEKPAVVHEERLAHVDAVDPHLVRVDALVPEAAVGVLRDAVEGLAHGLRRRPVPRVARAFVQEQHEHAGLDVVEVVGAGLVPAEDALFVDVPVDPALDVVEVARVLRRVVHLRHAEEDDAGVVFPAVLRRDRSRPDRATWRGPCRRTARPSPAAGRRRPGGRPTESTSRPRRPRRWSRGCFAGAHASVSRSASLGTVAGHAGPPALAPAGRAHGGSGRPAKPGGSS